jgi:hypothetical protein
MKKSELLRGNIGRKNKKRVKRKGYTLPQCIFDIAVFTALFGLVWLALNARLQ